LKKYKGKAGKWKQNTKGHENVKVREAVLSLEHNAIHDDGKNTNQQDVFLAIVCFIQRNEES